MQLVVRQDNARITGKDGRAMFKRLQVAAISGALAWSTPALAYPDGYDLLEALDSDDPAVYDQAVGYIAGVFQSNKVFNLSNGEKTVRYSLYCVKVPDRLTSEDIADVVCIWLRSPDSDFLIRVEGEEDPVSMDPLEAPAPSLVVGALRTSFPCD